MNPGQKANYIMLIGNGEWAQQNRFKCLRMVFADFTDFYGGLETVGNLEPL